MVHLQQFQYSALKQFSSLIRRELLRKNLNRQLSETVILTGQELGFCKDEIAEITEGCYEDLIRVYN